MNYEQREIVEKIMKNAPRHIWVTFRKEGVHMYPGADKDPKLATGDWDDVGFLGVPHRHIFHFRVSIEVFHNDRDIEFIMFKHDIEYYLDTFVVKQRKDKRPNYGDYSETNSCEMFANKLYDQIVIDKKYRNRHIKIEVSEDGENGVLMDYPKNQ